MSLLSHVTRFVPVSFHGRLRSLREQARTALGRYFCPVCERKVAAFRPLSAFYYEQWEKHCFEPVAKQDETCNVTAYSCPHCNASDRDRLFSLFLRERLPRHRPAEEFALVDFAPAPALSNHIKRNYKISYRTADLFMADVDDRVDLQDMPDYPEASFDAFICSHVLEHVPADTRAMAELFRILKPGGWGITMVPIPIGFENIREDFSKTTEAERWRHFGQGDHVRIYSRSGFLARLKDAGFNVRMFDRDHFGPRIFERSGLTTTSMLYISEKPLR